jgi:hypothetical protein
MWSWLWKWSYNYPSLYVQLLELKKKQVYETCSSATFSMDVGRKDLNVISQCMVASPSPTLYFNPAPLVDFYNTHGKKGVGETQTRHHTGYVQSASKVTAQLTSSKALILFLIKTIDVFVCPFTFDADCTWCMIIYIFHNAFCGIFRDGPWYNVASMRCAWCSDRLFNVLPYKMGVSLERYTFCVFVDIRRHILTWVCKRITSPGNRTYLGRERRNVCIVDRAKTEAKMEYLNNK